MSFSDSPLETDDPLAEKLTTSAESRLAAASKETRARDSKNDEVLDTAMGLDDLMGSGGR